MHDFFYRTNARTLYLLSIPSHYRYLITFSIITFLVSIWFFCVYQPLIKTQQSYTQISRSLIDFSESKNQSHNSNAHKKKLLEDLESIYNQEVKRMQAVRFLDAVNDIFTLIASHDLIFCSYMPQGSSEKDGFVKHSLLFELKGTFACLQEFFSALEKSNTLLVVDTIRMHRNTEDELSCKCVIQLFQMKKE